MLPKTSRGWNSFSLLPVRRCTLRARSLARLLRRAADPRASCASKATFSAEALPPSLRAAIPLLCLFGRCAAAMSAGGFVQHADVAIREFEHL
eukprot:4811138-Pleurochrysis_carterae.AAC.2